MSEPTDGDAAEETEATISSEPRPARHRYYGLADADEDRLNEDAGPGAPPNAA